jgi:hypothetical protein
VAIIQDLQGPRIRVGLVAKEGIEVSRVLAASRYIIIRRTARCTILCLLSPRDPGHVSVSYTRSSCRSQSADQ